MKQELRSLAVAEAMAGKEGPFLPCFRGCSFEANSYGLAGSSRSGSVRLGQAGSNQFGQARRSLIPPILICKWLKMNNLQYKRANSLS
jgi:hypothetical protein